MAVAKLIVIFVALCGAWGHPDADRHSNVGIIGGHQVSIEKVPYMASLRLNGTYHWCGASIIHEQFVLTAAHCIVPNREFKVLVGTDNVDGDGQLYDIEEIIKHEKYNEKNHMFDVCLIKLKTPLTFGKKVGKIDLFTGQVRLKAGTLVKATGWGSTGSNPVSPHLLEVGVPIISYSKCVRLYLKFSTWISPQMICAGKRGHDSCQGDSGGPLTHEDALVGVISFGKGCGEMPGVYIKISSVYSWITRSMDMYL